MSDHGLKGAAYSRDGTLHLIAEDAEIWVDAYLGESQPALCGGSFPNGPLHPVNGMELTDELRKGEFCPECFQSLLSESVTIPGFVVDGELVGEAARIGAPDGGSR